MNIEMATDADRLLLELYMLDAKGLGSQVRDCWFLKKCGDVERDPRCFSCRVRDYLQWVLGIDPLDNPR